MVRKSFTQVFVVVGALWDWVLLGDEMRGEERGGWVKDHLAVEEVAGATNLMELLWRQVLARPLEMNAIPEIRPVNVPLSM